MKRIDAQISFGDQFSANLIVSNLDGTNAITRPMHSFTNNFLENLRRVFLYNPTSTVQSHRKVKDNKGQYVTINSNYDNLLYQSTNQENAFHGIILGIGTPIRSSSMLQLGEALNSSQIEYIPTPGYSIATSHDTTNGGTIIISKAYKNISGVDLVVTEIGLSHYHGDGYAMFSHDIYQPGITFLNNQIKRFSIQINISPTIPKNFYSLLCIMFGINSQLIAISNNASTIQFRSYGLAVYNSSDTFRSITDSDLLGLFIGSSASALSSTNYRVIKVSTRTARTSIPQVVQGGSDTYLDFTNVFWNPSSVSAININEIGLYIGVTVDVRIYMPFRYLLSQTIVLQPLQELEVHFKIKTTFS